MELLLKETIGKVCTLTQAAGLLAEQGMIEAVQDGWVRFRTANGDLHYYNLRHVMKIDVMPEKVQTKWREKNL